MSTAIPNPPQTAAQLPPDLIPSLQSFDLARFAEPRAIDRPVPFFSWNEIMEPDEVRRQVDLIAEAGWGGVFVHSRVGLITPYMGEEWFRAVDAALDQCIKRGLKLWLYDEDKWPSGFSGGTVPLANPEYRQHTLIARPADLSLPENCAPVGDPQAGLQICVWQAPLGHDWFNGTCYTDLMSAAAMRKYLDDAYEPYYARYKEHYGSVIVGEFTDEPCPIFRIRLPEGSVPYSPGLPVEFRRMHGYDPEPQYHLLYRDGDGYAKFRLDYYRTVNSLFETNFSRQLSQWCQDHGIALTGHYMSEDGLFPQQWWGTKIMPNYRHQAIPGIDHLCRQIANPITAKQCQSVVNQFSKPRMLSELYGVDGGSLSFEDRAWIAGMQMCLGVNLLNPHLSLFTMAGCRKRDYPQNIYYQQPFWPLNRVLDDQLSRACAALSQGKYHAEMLLLHPQESVFVLSRPRLDEKSFDGLLGWNWECFDKESKEAIDALDKPFQLLISALLSAQRTFDLGDETIIAEDGSVALSDSGAPIIRIGVMEYPVVVVPEMLTIARTTFDLLREFRRVGGSVILCGKPPQLLDGAASDELSAFFAEIQSVTKEELPGAIAALCPPAVRATPMTTGDALGMTWTHLRDFEDGTCLVYAVNLHRMDTLTASIAFAGEWRSAKVLDGATGETRSVPSVVAKGSLNVDLELAPAQGILLLLDRRVNVGTSLALIPSPAAESLDIAPSSITVSRLDDNTLTLDYAQWRRGDGEFSPKPAPVIGVQDYLNSIKYDGPLTLRYPVRLGDIGMRGRTHLVLEHPERYTIRINDRIIQYEGLPFWRDIRWMPIDITGMLAPGDNVIELICVDFRHGDLTSIEDQDARYGTEIESIYLVGDFSVTGSALDEKPVADHWKEWGLPPIAVQCFAHGSFTLDESRALAYGDTTTQGLPFYAGCLSLQFALPELHAGEWFVRLQILDAAAAEARLDSKTIGHFVQHPFEIALPPDARPGATLEIVLYGTLRNLLGPHHHESGELAAVGPGHFTADSSLNERKENAWVLELAEGKPVKSWVDRYCMVSFGECGKISLIRRESTGHADR